MSQNLRFYLLFYLLRKKDDEKTLRFLFSSRRNVIARINRRRDADGAIIYTVKTWMSSDLGILFMLTHFERQTVISHFSLSRGL